MDSIQANSAGQRAGHGAIDCPPVLASGITITMTDAGGDYTATVAEGTYVVTVDGGFCLFSLTGETSTAANREYAVADGDTFILHVPYGYTTLYAECDTATAYAYLRKMQVQSPE